MAENDYKINIALGTSFDPAGLEQAQQQLEKLKPADATATHKPKRVEGESLFAASVRFRYLRDELKDGILFVYVEEI